mmetsp:Transcript_24094/g.66971  ORF Transcript_24094/g.66971 Transcript_24094/m.66971 type:complete len:275 (-) Transcript_24094:679-1503(-)
MAHTPMQPLATQYQNKPVLVCGKGSVLEIAASYGFRRAVSTEQLAATHPNAVPLLSPIRRGEAKGSEAPEAATEESPIEAVFVMTDPTDWYRDVQLIVDVVSSGGILRAKPSQLRDQPPVYIGHSDLLWAADFPRPRFGLGAFALTLETLYKEATGQSLPSIYFGKPQPGPFRWVEELLVDQARTLGWEVTERQSPFDAVFMVGDNPQVDVRGAKLAAAEGRHPWKAILVRTGVFQVEVGNCPEDPADIVVDHVDDAVTAAGHHLRSAVWHSMR